MEYNYRTWAEINLGAICNNVQNLKKALHPGTKAMAVVKADGYGHGAIQVAHALNDLVDAYGVAIVEEGVSLRENGITKPILILGYTPKESYRDVIRYDLSQTVYQYQAAAALGEEARKQNKKARLHIKVDTGMGRIGFCDDEEGLEEIIRLKQLKGCIIEGCYSHFSKADDRDLSFAKKQWNRFHRFTHILEEKGLHLPIKHISNSAGAIQMPEANMDMVRYGISMYGMYPSDQIEPSKVELEPAMTVRARISYIKEVEPGTPIGYGGAFITEEKTRVATIPVGYADGYPWALSGKGRILWNGKSAPIIGRICMDQFMVNVTRLDGVKEDDVVTLLGKDAGNEITAEELGRLAHSFHYEIVCNFSKRVPRVYPI